MQTKQAQIDEMKAEVKKEQEREFLLKNELRRLREEDIRKVKERQWRID